MSTVETCHVSSASVERILLSVELFVLGRHHVPRLMSKLRRHEHRHTAFSSPSCYSVRRHFIAYTASWSYVYPATSLTLGGYVVLDQPPQLVTAVLG